LSAVVTVDEVAIVRAMRLTLMHAKLLVEPAAATALAVALELAGGARDVGVLLTGGNVDAAVVASVLAGGQVAVTGDRPA